MAVYNISRFAELFKSSPGNEDNHYNGKIQAAHFSASNRFIFTLANIVKYVDRYKDKGKPVQDLEKALWYTKFQILDNWYFMIPFSSTNKITSDEFFKFQPKYTISQKVIIDSVYSYNWSHSLKYLKKVQINLEELIEQENG